MTLSSNNGAPSRWAFLDHPTPYGFAHRGGDRFATENTVAAFQHSVDIGYRYLETDVHLTRDGVLVAFHDNGLERIAGLEGGISDHDWADLAQVDLGAGASIPTLDELLTTFPYHRFNIDPKADASVGPLAATLEAHRAVPRVCVGSFSDARIRSLSERLGPDLCTSPGPRGLAKLWSQSLRLGGQRPASSFGAVQIPSGFGPLRLSARQVERFHASGQQVHVWTINDEDEMRRLLDIGVDAVMTDRTQLLKDVLVDRGQWASSPPTDPEHK